MRLHSLLLAAAALLSSLSLPLARTAPATEHPAASAPLTLAEALRLATTRDFAVSAARREAQATAGAAAQAGARRNPQCSASVEDTQRSTRVTTGTFDIPREPGGQRAARIAAAERSGGVARAEVGRATASLRADVLLYRRAHRRDEAHERLAEPAPSWA